MLTPEERAEQTKRDAEHIEFMYQLRESVDKSRRLIDEWFRERSAKDRKKCEHSWSNTELSYCLKCGLGI